MGQANEGKASKPTEKLFKKSGFFLLLLLNVRYYLDVLFLKIVGYHEGPDTNITHSPCCPVSSTLVPTEIFFAIVVAVVDFGIASLSHARALGSGGRGSCMRHIRTRGPRRRRRASFSSTSRGSPSARLFSSAWRCQKSWKEAIQRSQTYPPSQTTPTPWNTCGNSHCLHPNSLPLWKPPSLVPISWIPAYRQAVGLRAKLSLPKQCLCWHPSLTPSPKTLKRFWRPLR